MITFLLVQEGFLGSQINLNLPNVINSPCRPTNCVYVSHYERSFQCVQNMKSERVLSIQDVCQLITIVKFSFAIKEYFL